MIYRVLHETVYDYPRDVAISHNLAHLTARETPSQSRLSHKLTVSVHPAVWIDQLDFFGNPVTFFTIQEPHRGLKVSSLNVVEVQPPPPQNAEGSIPWEVARQRLKDGRDPASLDAYQFRFESPLLKAYDWLSDYASASFSPGRPYVPALIDLTHRIYTDFKYDSTATSTSTPLTEVFKLRRGVCQDFAHLQIACLRSIGLAARYVSGYLQTLPPPGRPRLIGADASHAWLSAYVPDLGWIDFDPTNDQIPQEKHVTLAWGRDYDDVSPIKGVILGGGRHSLKVAVDVAAVDG